jgi:hypothetical protein
MKWLWLTTATCLCSHSHRNAGSLSLGDTEKKMDRGKTQHSQGNLKIWFEITVGKPNSGSQKLVT